MYGDGPRPIADGDVHYALLLTVHSPLTLLLRARLSRVVCYRGLDSVRSTWYVLVTFGGQMWYQAGHYFFLIRFKVSLNYLDKLPKNLQYGEREKFSIYSCRSSGIPIRYSSDPGNISPISMTCRYRKKGRIQNSLRLIDTR